MRVVRFFGGLLFGVTLLSLLFFVLFAFHATTPVREDVKLFLDGEVVALPFSDLANSHLFDVRDVLLWSRVLCALLIVASLWLLSHRLVSFRVAGGFLVLLPLSLLFLSWDWLFTVLHLVLFPMGNWRFSPDSLLLLTYPESFFVTFAVVWGLSCVVVGGFLLMFCRKNVLRGVWRL